MIRVAVGILAGIGALFVGGYAFVAFFCVLDWRERRRQAQAEVDAAIERILTEGDKR